MKDLVVDLEGRPHGLVAFAETLAAAGLNVEGMCGLYADGTGIDHVLVEDVEAAVVCSGRPASTRVPSGTCSSSSWRIAREPSPRLRGESPTRG